MSCKGWIIKQDDEMTIAAHLAVNWARKAARDAGLVDGKRVTLRELGGFATGLGELDIGLDGTRRWDWPRMVAKSKISLRRAQSETSSKWPESGWTAGAWTSAC